MEKMSWIIKKKGQWVHDTLVGQLYQTLSLHTKVHVISRHKHISVHTFPGSALSVASSALTARPRGRPNGGREDGDG